MPKKISIFEMETGKIYRSNLNKSFFYKKVDNKLMARHDSNLNEWFISHSFMTVNMIEFYEINTEHNNG